MLEDVDFFEKIKTEMSANPLLNFMPSPVAVFSCWILAVFEFTPQQGDNIHRSDSKGISYLENLAFHGEIPSSAPDFMYPNGCGSEGCQVLIMAFNGADSA